MTLHPADENLWIDPTKIVAMLQTYYSNGGQWRTTIYTKNNSFIANGQVNDVIARMGQHTPPVDLGKPE